MNSISGRVKRHHHLTQNRAPNIEIPQSRPYNRRLNLSIMRVLGSNNDFGLTNEPVFFMEVRHADRSRQLGSDLCTPECLQS